MTIHSHNTDHDEPDNGWQVGFCPYCGSENVTTVDSHLEDDYYVYEMVCDDCECEFDDWYGLRHVETSWTPPPGDGAQQQEGQGGSVSPDPLGEIVADTMAAIHQIGEDARNRQGQVRNGRRQK